MSESKAVDCYILTKGKFEKSKWEDIKEGDIFCTPDQEKAYVHYAYGPAEKVPVDEGIFRVKTELLSIKDRQVVLEPQDLKVSFCI